MRLIIHAGIHRTGTTSLQEFLTTHRETLLQKGLAYPGPERNHQTLAWSLKRGTATSLDVKSILESQSANSDVILSAEDFCIHKDLRWLEEISSSYETRVVFYLRRQDHWIMSWYNQHIKWPFNRLKSQMGKSEFLGSIEEFHWLDYNSLIDRWTKVLGEKNVFVSVVESGQVSNVIEEFVSKLGITHDGLDCTDKRKNDSLPVHILEFARHLGIYDLNPKERTRLLQAMQKGLSNHSQPIHTVFTPEERNQILQRFEASNKAVAKRLYGRDSLFLEASPASSDPFYSFPDLSQEQLMRDWVAPVIKHML